MAIFVNNQPVADANNVGQFGATDGSIGAYKQAAEYARDAEYWANIAKQGTDGLDAIIKHVEDLYAQGAIQQSEIAQLKIDFANQNSQLTQKINAANTAITNANTATSAMNLKLQDVDARLTKLLNLTVKVTEVPPTSPATGSFDNNTMEFKFEIPQSNPGKDGVDGKVTDLSNTTTGIPTAADIGFFVKSSDNTVHKALMSDIAKTFPSVTSVQVGTNAAEQGDVKVTAAKLGLDDAVHDKEVEHFIKTYKDKAAADADVVNRKNGEKVLVWNDLSYDFYTVTPTTTPGVNSLILDKSERRILTVNNTPVDANGDVHVALGSHAPSLYIGEVLMFPYDPDNPYTATGVVPADGSLLQRSSYTELIDLLKKGSLPIVSESEWQAGKKSYYSWAKVGTGGTTGADGTATTGDYFRVPDWTGGEALRTPDKDTEGATGSDKYDGSVKAQKPYIATINGTLTPNETTGDITITAANVNAVPVTGGTINGDLNVNGTINDTNGSITTTGEFAILRNDSAGTRTGQMNIGAAVDGKSVLFAKGAVGSNTAAVVVLPTDKNSTVYTTENKPTLAELGAAKAAINDDITGLTGLQGPLKLGGDGVNGTDAVTLDQAKALVAAGGGTGGASLTGVMNDFLGAVSWFNGKRTSPPAGYLPADGQELNRVDYPDLWHAIDTGFYESVSDADWKSGGAASAVNPSQLRGKYSKGNGTTTFRLPDLNGAKTQNQNGWTDASTIPANFLRGDGGGTHATSIGSTGEMLASAAPNITGSIHAVASYADVSAAGALSLTTHSSTRVAPALSGSDFGGSEFAFNAANSDAVAKLVYGRKNADTVNPATEVRPNSITGIWLIRVKGAFEAPSTSFTVLTDQATPTAAKNVLGGSIYSDAKLDGVAGKIQAALVASKNYASGSLNYPAQAIIQATDRTSGNTVSTNYSFGSDSRITIPSGGYIATSPANGVINLEGAVVTRDLHTKSGGGCGVSQGTEPNAVELNNVPGSIGAGGWTCFTMHNWYTGHIQTGLVRGGSRDIQAYQITMAQDAGGTNQDWVFKADGNISTTHGDVAFQGSDIKLKDNVVNAKAGSLSRIEKIITREFDWKADGRHDRGYIAQELQKIDPTYVYESEATMNNPSILNVSQNALIADLIGAVQELKAEIEALKASK